jgi:adenine deaminase
MNAPDDLILNASDDIAVRQDLVLVVLGKRPADLSIRVGKLLHVYSRTWAEDQEIIIKGRRIAWVGPAGTYRGTVTDQGISKQGNRRVRALLIEMAGTGGVTSLAVL